MDGKRRNRGTLLRSKAGFKNRGTQFAVRPVNPALLFHGSDPISHHPVSRVADCPPAAVPVDSPPARRPPWIPFRSPVATLLVGIALFFLLVASGRIGNSDASITLDLSRALLRGTVRLSPDCTSCVRGIDGMRTSQYGIGHSLYLVPYVVAGRAAAGLVPRFPVEMWEEFFASFANGPVILLLLVYLARAWRRLGAGEARIAWGLVLFAFATPLGPYAKLPFSDPLMALGTFAAWYHWSQPAGRCRGIAAGLWLGFALLSRRQADSVVPVLLGLGILDAFRSRRGADLGLALAALAPAVVARLAYNLARFGSPWLERHPGLKVEKIADAALSGSTRFWKVICSDSEGLVVYEFIPVAIALMGAWGLWKASRRGAVAAGTVVAAGISFLVILPFSPGVSFGSRYLVYLVAFLGLAWPFVRIPKSPWARAGWALPVVASVWLMAGGIAIDPLPITLRIRRAPARFDQFGATVAEWRRILSPTDLPDLPQLEASSEWRHDPFRRPDFWWCHLWARRAPTRTPPAGGVSPHF